jgi:peptidoglycan/xylan/chitin deacetylase (PgdA/CDA1 family)
MRNAKPVTRMSAAMIRRIGDGIAPRAKGEGRLCIVNYHRVLGAPDPLLESEPTVDTFRWQMDLLAECFNVLPLDEAVSLLVKERMPPRAVAITFDDGYRSLHELAMPILRERALPATVFVTSGHMADASSMWNDIILEAVRRLPGPVVDLRDIGLDAYPLGGSEQRHASAAHLTERCKYLPPPARKIMLDRLQQLAGTDLRQHLMLTPEMIRDLVRNGIDIGGHTVTHPILARLDDETATREIIDNKRDLEQVTGRPLRLFAYPNGKHGADFDQRHVDMVRAAGYHAAFSTAPGAATRHHNPFNFPRSRPWDAQPLLFAARLLRWLHGGQHV